MKLNNTLLNEQQVKEESTRQTRKYIKTNEKGNTTYQNSWDAAKAVLRNLQLWIPVFLKKADLKRMA